MPEFDPLIIDCGCISAPAGCGKTHLIADSLKRHSGEKPILVLTHTNAGVAALRERLKKNEVPRKNYSLATIDGWAMRIAGMFPERSSIDPKVLALDFPSRDYPAIKQAALRLLRESHVNDLIFSNYSRLFVDEYQDCLLTQHSIVCELAKFLPTCIFGDQLQGIFNFGDTKVDWSSEVLESFPLVGELNNPYRWKNVGTDDLGNWLLEIRNPLISGKKIDLRNAPSEVEWVEITGDQDFDAIRRSAQALANGCEQSLIICKSLDRNGARRCQIAKQLRGAAVVENADLTDFMQFAGAFDFSGPNATYDLIDHAASVMRGVGGTSMKKRISSILAGTARNPPNEYENAALTFHSERTPQNAAKFLSTLNRQSAVTIFRPEVLRSCLNALNACQSADEFKKMAERAREERRFYSRTIGKRAVGSTLLLKGLEADQVVLVDTHTMDEKNLYVALTRGAKKVIVCSTTPLLPIS